MSVTTIIRPEFLFIYLRIEWSLHCKNMCSCARDFREIQVGIWSFRSRKM